MMGHPCRSARPTPQECLIRQDKCNGYATAWGAAAVRWPAPPVVTNPLPRAIQWSVQREVGSGFSAIFVSGWPVAPHTASADLTRCKPGCEARLKATSWRPAALNLSTGLNLEACRVMFGIGSIPATDPRDGLLRVIGPSRLDWGGHHRDRRVAMPAHLNRTGKAETSHEAARGAAGFRSDAQSPASRTYLGRIYPHPARSVRLSRVSRQYSHYAKSTSKTESGGAGYPAPPS